MASSAAGHVWPALAQAWSTNPAAVMLAAAACLLGLSLSVFLFAAIPTMLVRRGVLARGARGPGPRCGCCQYLSAVKKPVTSARPTQSGTQQCTCTRPSQAFRRSARAAELLFHALHQEVPDTAAVVRLSTLDLADCIEEITGLG